jgi:hypothetical protein
MVNHSDASVIASGRLAAHLLGVRRLEMVGFALESLGGLAKEAGPGRSWIEVFDWVAVDLNDRLLHHSLDELKTVVMAAEAAGYRPVMADRGVLVYRRPGSVGDGSEDALAQWRLPEPEMQRLTRQAVNVLETADLRAFAIRGKPVRPEPSGPSVMPIALVLQATADSPQEYTFRCTLRDEQEKIVASIGPFTPVGGNRPTSWWKRGEAYLQQIVLPLPPGRDAGQLTPGLLAEPYADPTETLSSGRGASLSH